MMWIALAAYVAVGYVWSVLYQRGNLRKMKECFECKYGAICEDFHADRFLYLLVLFFWPLRLLAFTVIGMVRALSYVSPARTAEAIETKIEERNRKLVLVEGKEEEDA